MPIINLSLTPRQSICSAHSWFCCTCARVRVPVLVMTILVAQKVREHLLRMPKLPPPGRTFGSCQPGAWRYHELPPSSGATCLDGSPYGFYFIEGVVTRKEPPTMHYNESWLLLFEGGGWCWSPEDCALRADSKLGSSSAWPKGNGNVTIGGLVNRCCFCTKFCRFRRVYLKSCDGHSFAGNATIAAPENRPSNVPATLHSMGRVILRAVVSELVARFGLLDAKSVLVAGCSAGGLAALLNAEWMRSEMQAHGVRPGRFKVASLAGVFFSTPPSPPSAAGGKVAAAPFEEQMRSAVEIGRMQMPARCASSRPHSEHWRCLFDLAPVESLPIDLPGFVYQSRLDLWQTNCVFAAGHSRFFAVNCSSGHSWRQCLGWMQPLRPSSRCSTEQWAALRAYEERNHEVLSSSPALRRAGYGSFVHSCYDHCPSTYGLINTGASLRPGTVNDSINLRETLHLWFLDQARDAVPAWNHTHVGCWNSAVANRVPGKAQPVWCRRQECGAPEKLHKDDTQTVLHRIAKHGWSSSWGAPESVLGRGRGRGRQ